MVESLNSAELQKYQHQISQTRSFQSLISTIQLKNLYNVEQICQNFYWLHCILLNISQWDTQAAYSKFLG